MADPKQKGENAAKGGEASPSQWAGLGFAGLWLMALICISVFISVVVFGATQFQTRFASLSFGGGPLTIWKAEQLRTEWIASLANLAAASKSLNADRTALEAANEKGLAASAQAAEAANNANALHKQLLDKVRIPYPDTAANTSLTTLISLLEKQQPVAEADRQLARSASDAEELARKSFAEAVAANNRTNALQASITKKNDELKSAQGFAGSLLTSKNNVELPDDQRIQIENAI
jgi:hypothetical protein